MSTYIDTKIDPAGLSDDELRARKQACSEEATKIAGQIDAAKARVWTEGIYADPDWMARAKGALRHLRGAEQRANHEMGARRRVREGQDRLRLQDAFMRIAQRDLEEADFQAMLEEARQVARGELPAPVTMSAPVAGAGS